MSKTTLNLVTRADDLATRVSRTLERDGLSMAKAAKEVGVSSATLSTWLRGSYAGSVKNVNERVERWLALREDQARRGMPAQAHAALAVTEEISLILSLAQTQADCALIYGAAGAGKSYAAQRYATERPQVALSTMSPAVSTTLSALKRVARALSFAPPKTCSAAAVEDMLVERLADRNALLVVDEAHHLSQAMLDELRCIHDRAGCGLALLGNEPLWARLAGGERAAQLVSRIGLRKHLGMPAAGDADLIAATLLRRQPNAAEQKIVRAAARRAGGLRAVCKLVFNARTFALGDEREAIAAEDLAAAAEAA